eukprot:6048061-Prymnesium_polylepis.2
MQAVYQIPSRVAKQQQPPPDGDGGAGSGGDVAALGFVFDKMKSMSDAFIDSAMIEATRPPEVPVSERRFTVGAPPRGREAARALWTRAIRRGPGRDVLWGSGAIRCGPRRDALWGCGVARGVMRAVRVLASLGSPRRGSCSRKASWSATRRSASSRACATCS